jgi:hypothetical protein
MKLAAVAGPHEGSLQATFMCPRCQCTIALLTNPWETQLVQTLGVRIGGGTTTSSPYAQVVSSLAVGEQDSSSQAQLGGRDAACPFAGMIGQTEEPPIDSSGVRWSAEARLRIERIPSFIRPMVQRAIERYAGERGHSVITEAVMDEARARLGM